MTVKPMSYNASLAGVAYNPRRRKNLDPRRSTPHRATSFVDNVLAIVLLAPLVVTFRYSSNDELYAAGLAYI